MNDSLLKSKSVRLSQEQIEALERYAKEDKRDPSQVIRIALDEFFQRQLIEQQKGGNPMTNQPELFEVAAHYPDVPGFKRRGTSEEAAAEVAEEASKLQLACFDCLKIAPSTADEVAAQLGRSVLAIRPRISELVAKDWVVETPQRRLNASGKWAAVWKVT